MKKRGIIFAMAILMGIPFVVKAASESDDTGIRSYGNIFYEDATGSVRIYAEDIALLQKELDSIPDEIFDPVLYSHTHVWEYKNITDQEHTKHCDGCGAKYDIVSRHIMDSKNPFTISFDGQEYPGYEKVCGCGYKWKEEIYHNLVYVPKDEMYHTQFCVLDGTPYCSGMESSNTLHTISLYPTDDSHHQKRCGECGYRKGNIEACVFEIEEKDTENGEFETEEEEEIRKYCECGNFITESKTDIPNTEITRLETNESFEISVSGNDISISGNNIKQENTEKEGENKS